MQVVVHISIAFFLPVVEVDDESNFATSSGRADGLYQAFDTITQMIMQQTYSRLSCKYRIYQLLLPGSKLLLTMCLQQAGH